MTERGLAPRKSVSQSTPRKPNDHLREEILNHRKPGDSAQKLRDLHSENEVIQNDTFFFCFIEAEHHCDENEQTQIPAIDLFKA